MASSDVNVFLLSFHDGWMIWGVGAGRKLLKCCGNCCDGERDAGLLLVNAVVGMLRVECSVLDGHHNGNNSVFQEFVGKPNLC